MTQTDFNGGHHWGLIKTTPADQVKLLNALALPGQVLNPSSPQYQLSFLENVVG